MLVAQSSFAKDFELTALLGVGGEAAAYAVRDRRTGRLSAFKLLLPYKDAAVTSWIREYHRLRELQQKPNIVKLAHLGLLRFGEGEKYSLPLDDLPAHINSVWIG